MVDIGLMCDIFFILNLLSILRIIIYLFISTGFRKKGLTEFSVGVLKFVSMIHSAVKNIDLNA